MLRDTETALSPRSVDSFEQNMTQLQRTNDMLNNIETKLNRFLVSKAPARTNAGWDTRAVTSTATKFDYLGGPSHSMNPAEQTREDSIRAVQFTENPGHKTERDRTSASREMSNELLDYSNSPNEILRVSFSRKKDTSMRRGDDSFARKYMRQETENVVEVGPSNGISKRLKEIEEAYEAKVALLNERIVFLEGDLKEATAAASDLRAIIAEMQAQAERREITQQAEVRNREARAAAEAMTAAKNDANLVYKRQLEQYLERIETLKRENSTLTTDNTNLRERLRLTLEERDALVASQKALVENYNQLLQYDVARNEKSLGEENKREPLAELQIVDSAPTFRDEEMVRMMTHYRDELEKIKTTHEKVITNFEKEMQNLRKELQFRHEENGQLQAKVRSLERQFTSATTSFGPINDNEKSRQHERSYILRAPSIDNGSEYVPSPSRRADDGEVVNYSSFIAKRRSDVSSLDRQKQSGTLSVIKSAAETFSVLPRTRTEACVTKEVEASFQQFETDLHFFERDINRRLKEFKKKNSGKKPTPTAVRKTREVTTSKSKKRTSVSYTHLTLPTIYSV
eukprot:TRINITY_DN9104_c0_g1_i10.p1 TRINITY_DN9104_c0_g1~~TRINITY_DN9104_c0_g1_i10.p1  ORF type:complete len:572 (-),score=127.71 TRINITY_DN9104_c0_g1_i10:36-1751(-)